MKRTTPQRVEDIQAAIERCFEYAPHLHSSQPQQARMAADAIERNIGIIGEAATHLSTEVTQAFPQIDWAGVRGMRNSLVHQYYDIDANIIQDVLDTKLRELSEALRHFIT